MKHILFFSMLWVGVPAQADTEQRFSSGETQVSLIELFSSEGCSSCPPAERWLASLREAPGLWRDFVPLEFHVNYWDRLGWPDRFASQDATQREYDYTAAWHSASVYTPCFVRDGAEWRDQLKVPGPAARKADVLTVLMSGGKSGRAEFAPMKSSARDGFDLHIALLGSGLSSHVTAGENRGEMLKHEFVVLAFATHALAADASQKIHRAEFVVPVSKITDAPRQAVAAWVTRHGDSTPLQATGGWLESR